MALVIYGSARSRTMRTLWIAAELGLEYEHAPLEWNSPALKSPEFLALNPAGAIPMIVDDGVVVAESMAIALHLAQRYGDAGPEPLYPHGPQAVADVLRWSFWAQGQLEPWVQQDERLAGLLAQAGEAADAEVARSLGVLERALTGRSWLAADHFTVADLNVAGVLSPSRARRISFERNPAVADWLMRCHTRPAAQAARSRHAAG
ncbi:MAG: glutathione S-transferase family protein [Phenylobacterium sp.]|uniref:glutathione S-transferase family protein n=1 Tax=Phenylobacterium sp. TaxID=1871053 RepID=UPI001A454CDB|nr:glutathione S-transferase family protein [Phenylobacterium sp.]MBL8772910.1 glutathione S-transferase family protein [Phenylobacterium sp.]